MYTPRPNPSGDTLVDSRDQIRENFQIASDRFAEDHVTFNGGANTGLHKWTRFPEQDAADIPAAVANISTLYAKENTFSNLHIQSEGGPEYQLTTMTAATDAVINRFGTKANDPTAGQDGGFTFLPGGMIMCYGRKDHLTDPVGTVTFPLAFNGTPYSVTATPESSGTTDSFHIVSISNTQFTYASQGVVPTAIQYIAVGTI